jgi:hypothetical protein
LRSSVSCGHQAVRFPTQRSTGQGSGCPRQECATGRGPPTGVSMIIVSGSGATSDIPRYADARPISVYTRRDHVGMIYLRIDTPTYPRLEYESVTTGTSPVWETIEGLPALVVNRGC